MSYLGTIDNKVYERFGDDFDRFFERGHFLGHSPFRKSWLAKGKAAANMSQDEGGYDLQIALPGFQKHTIEIRIENGMLVVSAVKGEHEDTNKEFIVSEFHQENVYRSFTLNDNIDEEGITAKLENGILHIFLPKKKPHEPTTSKIIEIE